ncbi:helix-turn-helix transcriptional regulator [Emergencia timonensis]|uniref:helix-turn-helix domain-containing protein n=1 Tax=Emergencia timonensis TaxID=1776384 RepID=UPI001FA7D65F|nr:helix-turn-helix transcriptional regulator [Emergencia timonensis]WNX89889.1 helix-turn-helix transcriptional regulator [Emergencia timonensis]
MSTFFAKLLNYFPPCGIISLLKEVKDMLQLYHNIKNRRLKLGLTQSELAKKLGYSDKSMIAKIEKGAVDLPQSKIIAFAEALNVSPSDLMGWDTDDDVQTIAAHHDGEEWTEEELEEIERFKAFVRSKRK